MGRWQSAGLATGTPVVMGLIRQGHRRGHGPHDSSGRPYVFFHAATAVLILTLSGCAHRPPATASHQPVDTVVLPASVPGGATFCIESLYLSWPSDDVFVRRETGMVCAWTVADVRNWAIKQKQADE